MQDRPTHDELLAAIERFLRDEVMPNIGGARSFHARVAANALAIIRRELECEEEHLVKEWDGLNTLLGTADRPQTLAGLREKIAARNEDLCARIRTGDEHSELFHDAVFGHVRQTVRDKLLVSNPGWMGEDAVPISPATQA
jgi:hypothetical protein